MTGTMPVNVRAFLGRTALLIGLLGVMAGILGMHAMTGSHSMHAAGL